MSAAAMSAEIAGQSAAGALRWRSRQKPRFLSAADEVMSAEIAGSNFRQSNQWRLGPPGLGGFRT
jgi:hypothetical protein